MERTGKTEDVLASRVETSRLDGGVVKKLEGVQSRFRGMSERSRAPRWRWRGNEDGWDGWRTAGFFGVALG